jgi:acyl-CoA thioesterase FadM
VAPPDGGPAHSLALSVRPRDLDPLDHVNNAVYVDWLDEALEAAGWRPEALGANEAGDGETWRLEYLASAGRGDEVVVDLHGEAAAWRARIRRADGLELMRASATRR